MAQDQTIILAGGGTGGHLYPGIAVAQAMRSSILPQAKPLFLCTEREMDRVILSESSFDFIPQPIVPPLRSVGGLLRFWQSWRQTKEMVKRLLRERRPCAAIGLGGYAAGVAVKLAAEQGIPTVILNPDLIPGDANHFLLPRVRVACCQFDSSPYVSSKYHSKLKITGCPIRKDIVAPPPRAEAAARLELDPLLHTLLITGASQGALTVNEAMMALAGTITLNGWQILHLCGREHGETVRRGYREKNVAARVIDFTPAMADVWAVTDLALSRSGASSCAELTTCGIPSILMPYPFHKDMHQRANARILADAGAAVVADDERDAQKNAEKLRPILQSLLYDAAKRQAMSESARKLGHPDAAEAVARIVADLIAGKTP